MKRKIGLKELHSMASQMKYYDFENWIAKELFDQPETADTSELTDKLFLHNDVGQNEPSELEKLLLTFLKGDGYKKLAEEQGRAMQEHNYRLKEVERQRMIKEKYDYLKYRIEEGLSVSDEQQKEYEYVKFLCERK